MAKVPTRVESRIKEGLKRFQPLIEQAKSRDIGEADTSTLVKDILADVFGYDKYSEITGEYQIKGTYCDLAIKLDSKLVLLIEVKSIGSDLRESHVKQAVDYGANQGVEWVILTNAQAWQLYRVHFGRPITNELILSFELSNIVPKDESAIEQLYLLSREAQNKSLLDEYHEQKQALSKYYIAALVMSEPVLSVIRRELKRLSPDVKIAIEEIAGVLTHEVIKRDALEGEKATEASKRIARIANKLLRAKSERDSGEYVIVSTDEAAPEAESPSTEQAPLEPQP